jgi:hypothetical protein
MGRAGVDVHGLVAVVLGALVLVHDDEADRGPEGLAEFGAGLDGYAVFLVAGRGDGALARAAAVELGLDVGFGEGHAGGWVVDDAPDGFAVGFTEAGVDGLGIVTFGEIFFISLGAMGHGWRWRRRPSLGWTHVVTLKTVPKVDMIASRRRFGGGRERRREGVRY